MIVAGRIVENLRQGRAQRLLSAATAASALPLGAEIYINHYGGSFGNRWMWSPVLLAPVVSAAGVGGVRAERPGRRVLPPARSRSQAGRLPRGQLQPRDGAARAGPRLAGAGGGARGDGRRHAPGAVARWRTRSETPTTYPSSAPPMPTPRGSPGSATASRRKCTGAIPTST